MMNEFHKRILIQNRVRLVNDLQSETLINYMIQDEIMTPNHAEMLKSKLTTQYKNEYFLDLLATRGPKAFGSFLKNLKESEDDPLYEFVNNLASQPPNNMDINQRYTGPPQQVSPDSGSMPVSTNQFQPGFPQQVSPFPGSLISNASQYPVGHPQQVSSAAGSLIGNDNQYHAGHTQQVSPDVADGPPLAGHRTPSYVAKENKAMPQIPERRTTEIDLNTFSGKMGFEWKSFIRSLGLKNNEIFHASSGCHTERDKIFSCLVKWRNREANKATVRALVEKCIENEIDVEVYDFLLH
ncbi:death domain-containing protein CRADD-like isoform X2 [Anneissia japonica]|uniref:death domain-containing protein CRADD-like isoform X2 n=1 Tax=Anneissia japonica TaxID=1529436 RepID=UPI0014256559|nr:death domain-containing protein CRADD-like isoform X2 [Anneissia japonica]